MRPTLDCVVCVTQAADFSLYLQTTRTRRIYFAISYVLSTAASAIMFAVHVLAEIVAIVLA